MSEHEGERDCTSPGTITPSQLKNLPAEFTAAGIKPERWGAYITDALAFYGMRWRYGGTIEKLSCIQAGRVLLALFERGRVPQAPKAADDAK